MFAKKSADSPKRSWISMKIWSELEENDYDIYDLTLSIHVVWNTILSYE